MAQQQRFKEIKKTLNDLEYYAHGLFNNFHKDFFLDNGKMNKKEINKFSDEIVLIAKEIKDFEKEEGYTYFRNAIELIMSYFEFANVPEDQTYLGMLQVYKYMSKYSINDKYKTTFELFIEDLKRDESVSKKTINNFEKKLNSLFMQEEYVKHVDTPIYFGYYLKQYCINKGYSIITNDKNYKRFNQMIEENKEWIKRYSESEKKRILLREQRFKEKSTNLESGENND